MPPTRPGTHDPPLEGAGPAEQAAAALEVRLGQLRRHATWLERLAVMVGTAGACTAAVLALADLELLVPAVSVALASVTAWGLLRAFALVLHVRADTTELDLALGRDLVRASRERPA